VDETVETVVVVEAVDKTFDEAGEETVVDKVPEHTASPTKGMGTQRPVMAIGGVGSQPELPY
jgi:hypothetical protein